MAGLQFGINTLDHQVDPQITPNLFQGWLLELKKKKQNKTRNADYCGEVLEIDILSTGEVISYFVCG